MRDAWLFGVIFIAAAPLREKNGCIKQECESVTEQKFGELHL